jgi:neopullulanase
MLKMKKYLLLLVLFCTSFQLYGQQKIMDHVCPSFWWIGMKNHFLQVLFHGNDIGGATVTAHYPGVSLTAVHKVENDNYLFLDFNISSKAHPGKIPVHFKFANGKEYTYSYELKSLNPQDGKTRALGVNSGDLIYLLMPDRFSNGDTSNDRIPGMLDQTLNVDGLTDRHGGDLKGVMNHLDYLKNLGVTAIWMTPVIENNQRFDSYHGYAFTNYYHVDPRLGTNEDYVDLVKAAHEKGLKIVQDIVCNHMGNDSWLFKDLPMKDWLNQWPNYTQTSFRESPLFDPHGAAIDKKVVSDGWFVRSMPDLNQRNPYVANFLIENAIWWVEYAGVDAYRVDTYIYCDLNFMNRFNNALLRQFPKLHIFGETWVNGVTNQAYFARNNFTNIPFKSDLPGVCDFQSCFALQDALTKPDGWTTGIIEIYRTLAKDFVYQDPMKNVVFVDNHDMSRIFSVVGESLPKFESAFAWLLTTRGIPEMYYGDEILMKNFKAPDGLVREDFPGGWPHDTINKFVAAGRTDTENIAFNFIRTLANYRLHSKAIRFGKLMQYLPENNVYVYFRYDAHSTVMVVMNGNDKTVSLSTNRFSERMKGFTKAKNIITGETINNIDSLSIPAHAPLVLELEK